MATSEGQHCNPCTLLIEEDGNHYGIRRAGCTMCQGSHTLWHPLLWYEPTRGVGQCHGLMVDSLLAVGLYLFISLPFVRTTQYCTQAVHVTLLLPLFLLCPLHKLLRASSIQLLCLCLALHVCWFMVIGVHWGLKGESLVMIGLWLHAPVCPD